MLVDGKARVACQTSLEKTQGAEVLTSGRPANRRTGPFQRGFLRLTALCSGGFCTPGIVMRAKALIDRKGSELTQDETARHLGGHLCRCTGYVKILDAVADLAQGNSPQPQTPGGVGSSAVKYEALELAAGQRPYIDDMFFARYVARSGAAGRTMPVPTCSVSILLPACRGARSGCGHHRRRCARQPAGGHYS